MGMTGHEATNLLEVILPVFRNIRKTSANFGNRRNIFEHFTTVRIAGLYDNQFYNPTPVCTADGFWTLKIFATEGERTILKVSDPTERILTTTKGQ